MDLRESAGFFGLDITLSGQDGLIRRDQAMACGLTSAQISAAARRGRWARLLPGVYLVGAAQPSIQQRVRAVWLWAGPDSLVAGAAAAWWHGLTPEAPAEVEVILPLARALRPPPGIRVIRSEVAARDRARRDGIWLTAVPRTCLDLIRWSRADILEDALRTGRVTVEKLSASLAWSRNRRGQQRASVAVAEVIASPWSKAERLAHRILREARIVGWVANQRALSVPGAVFPDIAFTDVKLAVEIDSRRFHDRASDAQAWERDHERELALVRAGWTVIRVTYRQLMEQPRMIVEAIVEVLARLRSAAVAG